MLLHFLFIGYDFYYYLQLCALYILLLLVYYFWCSSSGKLYVMETLIKFIYRDIYLEMMYRGGCTLRTCGGIYKSLA